MVRLAAIIEAGNQLYFGMYHNILTKQVRAASIFREHALLMRLRHALATSFMTRAAASARQACSVLLAVLHASVAHPTR